MNAVLADRIQFAFTVMFHYLFPIATMGTAPFVAWYTLKASRGDVEAESAASFWTRIFSIGFAAGVVTGIPLEFQFGTNWAAFATRSGAVIGQPLALESVYAFFLESVFLGVLLYGRRFVGARLHALSAVLVCIGAWLSGFFIVCTDAWMQHPVGYVVEPDGRIGLSSLGAVLLSPFALWQFAHVLTGALVSGGFVVAGVGAYYVLSQRNESLGRRFVRAGTLAALLFSLLAVFPTGDRNSADVTRWQPAKLAAMEGLFMSETGAPLAIIGMPDVSRKQLIDPIYMPRLLSYLAYGNWDANVRGITEYAPEMRPPVELTYYAYHIMVGLGTIFVGVTGVGALLLGFGRLYGARAVLWALMLLMPFPYVANEAGWMVTEVGRQPWIVYGLMMTSAAASPTVPAGETLFTLMGFMGMYLVLGILVLYLFLREVGIGPVPAP